MHVPLHDPSEIHVFVQIFVVIIVAFVVFLYLTAVMRFCVYIFFCYFYFLFNIIFLYSVSYDIQGFFYAVYFILVCSCCFTPKINLTYCLMFIICTLILCHLSY